MPRDYGTDAFSAVLGAARGSAGHSPALRAARDALARGDGDGAVAALQLAGVGGHPLLDELAALLAAPALAQEELTVRSALAGIARVNRGWHRADPLSSLAEVSVAALCEDLRPRLQRALNQARKEPSGDDMRRLAHKRARQALLAEAQRALASDPYGHAWLLGRREREMEQAFSCPGDERGQARMMLRAAIDAELLAEAARNHAKLADEERRCERFVSLLAGRAWRYRKARAGA